MKASRQSRQYRELMRLQEAVARQQAQVKQVDAGVGASRPVVGMPADVVLTLPGYGRKERTSNPRILGYDRNGLKVRWYYRDMILTIKRLTPNGYYQVIEVRERGSNGQTTEVHEA